MDAAISHKQFYIFEYGWKMINVQGWSEILPTFLVVLCLVWIIIVYDNTDSRILISIQHLVS